MPPCPMTSSPGSWLHYAPRTAFPRVSLEFLILTAARTGEVIGTTPDEIKDQVWTVPAGRIKGGVEHRVPLSEPASAIVETMRKERRGPFLFRGGNLPSRSATWRCLCSFVAWVAMI
jgi:integrase